MTENGHTSAIEVGMASTYSSEYWREYVQRPEVKAKRLAYNQRYIASRTPEQKQKARQVERERARDRRQNMTVEEKAKERAKARVGRLKHYKYGEKERLRARQYYIEHRDQMRAQSNEWRKRNPEKYRAHARKQRAKRNCAAGHSTHSQWLARLAYHGNKCRYCGISGIELHADHAIPLARGGTNWPSNLVPACPTCNRSKKTQTYKEFVARNIAKFVVAMLKA